MNRKKVKLEWMLDKACETICDNYRAGTTSLTKEDVKAEFVDLWKEKKTTNYQRLIAQSEDNAVTKLKIEVERLRICGNCQWRNSTIGSDPLCDARKPRPERGWKMSRKVREIWYSDHCHFEPSRWEEVQ